MKQKTGIFPLVAALVWMVAVLADYYVSSASYYAEKISVFGRFFLGAP